MQIKQWEDSHLAQFSYAILSEGTKEIILIDPSRNPQQYLDFALESGARIIGIIETHPHADFVSSHVEISNLTGAKIYASRLVDAGYDHMPLNDGDDIKFGEIRLEAIDTPGHSPDSISIVLIHDGKQKFVFSGDTLFIGDCGRPDLRETAGNLQGTRLELAKSMYHTLRDRFLPLDDDVVLYPAHGAGTLCGKGLSKANSSKMDQEKQTNWSLQFMSEDEFVQILLNDQPFVPAYFPYDVALNRLGAASFKESVQAVVVGGVIKSDVDAENLLREIVVVDAREETNYKHNHLSNSINLMEGDKFETWLGSIIEPGEKFYLAGQNRAQIERLIARAASIGYESQIQEAFTLEYGGISEPLVDINSFRDHSNAYTIIDVRNRNEVNEKRIFRDSISIPLPELRNRISEIPTDKPIMVHCAGGYRSAAGSSIIQSVLKKDVDVYDLGESVREFM